MSDESPEPSAIVLDIDKEFAWTCYTLDDNELAILTTSLLAEGCRDAIRYWQSDGKNLIVDGHNRYTICTKYNIPYRTEEMHFESREHVIEWIVQNQLGRRNASAMQKSGLMVKLSYARGKMHIDEKKEIEANAQGSGFLSVTPLRDVRHHPSIASVVAERTGVSERRIHKDTAFAHDLDNLMHKSPILGEGVLEELIDKRDVRSLSCAAPEVLKNIEQSLTSDWRSMARSVTMHSPEELPPATGGVVANIRNIDAMESTLGKVVRLKSAALKDCGGKQCAWAVEHELKTRNAIDALFVAILAWKKAATAAAMIFLAVSLGCVSQPKQLLKVQATSQAAHPDRAVVTVSYEMEMKQ